MPVPLPGRCLRGWNSRNLSHQGRSDPENKMECAGVRFPPRWSYQSVSFPGSFQRTATWRWEERNFCAENEAFSLFWENVRTLWFLRVRYVRQTLEGWRSWMNMNWWRQLMRFRHTSEVVNWPAVLMHGSKEFGDSRQILKIPWSTNYCFWIWHLW